ncbi:MAG: 1-deoxy-D-xylulose-5-phosphate reductoisomerase [Bacteroidales bacterium]|nr:1-deoxy-D-xylulose-5-phosphate reductoisomerase [Candidatus Scybalousia scybalohippi]
MKDNKKHIAILGSTGSIGTQTLDVIRKNPELFCVEVLTANENADLLVQQALEFQPNCVVIANEQKYEQVKDALKNTFIKVFAGEKSIEDVVCFDEIDIVLVSLVGFSGLKPTISAIKAKKVIALANKETLVVGGELITALAEENNVPILPVDSEHSAIFQCLQGEILNPVKRILLTASGGAFLGKKREELAGMKASNALKHPNWSMGKKVTIDSATLMNKGLEVIEARWLFGVDAKNIVPVIHSQSIVHSMVEFEDGSIKAQMGKTDMRLPILYALSYPKRVKMPELSMDIFSISNLTFSKPDTETFPCLSLAFKAIEKGGNLPTIMNAANEIAVQRFLEDKISFLQIPEIIEKAMDTYTFIQCPTYEDFLATDKEVRESLAKIY